MSHGSAPVHATIAHSPTANTIPPPVIPFQRSYAPLRPKRRSRSRHGSVSSASEQFPREVSAGYEASVSDDLDRVDRDNRSTIRPSAQQIAGSAPAQSHFPPMHSSRRPSAPQVRPMSPIPQSLRPQSPSSVSPNNRGPGPESQPLFGDKYGTSSGVMPPPPPPPQSPSRATFALNDDSSVTPLATKGLHIKSVSDAAAEREQALQVSENKIDYAHRAWRHHQQKEDRVPDWVREQPGAREPRRIRPKPNETEEDRSESWVFVTRDSPRTNNNDRPPTPQEMNPRMSPIATPRRTREREQNFSPSRYNQASYGARPLVMPNTTRNQPPPIPPGASDPRANNLPRPAGQPVPPMWTVAWKGEGKSDPKTIPQSSAQWRTRLSPKVISGSRSMDNLKAASYNHPATLQPGRRGPNPLPTNRPYIPGDGTSRRDHSSTTIPRIQQPYDVQRGHGSRPLPPVASPSNTDFRSPGLSPSLNSPSNDPYARPQSAIGDNSNSPQLHRYDRDLKSPTSYIDLEYGHDTNPPRSPRAPSPPRKLPGFGTLATNPADRSDDTPEAPPTPPLTPASPVSPRWGPNGLPESSSTPINTHRSRISIDEALSGETTLMPDQHNWISEMLDGRHGDSTLIPMKGGSKLDLGKVLPLPPQMQPSSSLPNDMSPMTPRRHDPAVDSDSDSGDDGGGTLWNTKPMIDRLPSSSPRPKSILRGPPLTVQIENSTGVHSVPVPGSSQSGHTHASLPPIPPQPTRPPPPPPVDPSRGANSRTAARGSTFTDMRDYTWAPRPAPEEVYDRLEEFFPNHDLDKPVIEATSGGTSPTVGGDYLTPPASTDKSRIKGKKSIRIVAQEHKKRIDRTSRAAAESSSLTNVMRKRSTKLWGSRLEEVTTAQAKGLTALPDSPSAGPKRKSNFVSRRCF